MEDRRTVIMPYLDGWRGLAIVAVLVCHFGPRPAVAWIGDYGVQMFFALSGFLMGQLLFVKKVALPDFFFRRFSRVFPAFLLFVSGMYVYARYFQPSPYEAPMEELLATTLFLRTYLPDQISIWSNNWPIGNVWSLNVEEHSYIFLAILALIARTLKSDRVASVLLVSSIASSVAIYFFYSSSPPAGASPWHLRSECAAIGLLFSATLSQLRLFYQPVVSRSTSTIVVCLLMLLSAFLISAYRMRGGKIVFAPILLAVALNFLHFLPELAKSALSSPLLLWFGKCSFSLYLWQQPFYTAVQKTGFPTLLGLALAILTAALSFKFVEDPLRIGLNRRWGRFREKRAACFHPDRETTLPDNGAQAAHPKDDTLPSISTQQPTSGR